MERIKLAIEKARDSARQGGAAPEATGGSAHLWSEPQAIQSGVAAAQADTEGHSRSGRKRSMQAALLLLCMGIAGAIVFTTDVETGAATATASRTDPPSPTPEPRLEAPPSTPAVEVVQAAAVVRDVPALPVESGLAVVSRDTDLSSVTQVEAAVEAWRKAWTARDMTNYLAAYSERFMPANGSSRPEWLASRYRNVGGRKDIEVAVRDLKIDMLAQDRARVGFLQDYASGTFRETGQPKTLDLSLEDDGRWRIVGEWQGQAPAVR